MSEEKKPSVLLSALDNYGGYPFNYVYDVVFPCYGVSDMEAAAALTDRLGLVIWGGADISPAIYNHRVSQRTGAGPRLSSRDAIEWALAKRAFELGIPVIGICRGAQLLCAMSGGSLVQHVNGHAGGYHKIVTRDEEVYNCPTLHHQMMYPWKDDGTPVNCEWIAWMPERLGKEYVVQPDEDGKERSITELPGDGREPEILWFPETKSLCIQSHPEFVHNDEHPFVQYTLKLTRQYILPETE